MHVGPWRARLYETRTTRSRFPSGRFGRGGLGGVYYTRRPTVRNEGDRVALLNGIDTVYYRICSMDKAIAFYEGVLGLTLKNRAGNDWAEFDVGGYDLALEGELATRPHGGGATIVFATADIDALEAQLATHDVVRREVEDLGGAKLLEFFDPDGNKLVAMQAVS